MEHKMLSGQIEGAQKKVEEQNFVARKNVLKYDDVMNVQRQEIYAQRRRVLEGEDMSEFVLGWIDEVIERTVANYTETEYGEEWDLDALVGQLHALYGTDITVDELREDGVDLADRDALVEEFRQDARDVYEEKNEQFGLNPDTDAPLDGAEGPADGVPPRGPPHVRGPVGRDPRGGRADALPRRARARGA
jgi:preprotein translocase subunit SecA